MDFRELMRSITGPQLLNPEVIPPAGDELGYRLENGRFVLRGRPVGSQPLPLLAQWDFSVATSVNGTDSLYVYAVELARKAAVNSNDGDSVAAVLGGLDPLHTANSVTGTGEITDEWPTDRRVNGRTCFVLPPGNSSEFLAFNVDAPMIEDADVFLVQQLDEVTAGSGIYGMSAWMYPQIIAYDNGGDTVWACQFWLGPDLDPEGNGVTRTTDVVVDTELHVVSIANRAAGTTTGLYIDGVLHEWQEADPVGWPGGVDVNATDFYWLGTPANFGAPNPGIAGAYCEARIYDPLTDAEHKAVAAELLAKWSA